MARTAGLALLLVGMAMVPCGAQAQSNPSFDCRKATALVEKLICSDAGLGDLDRQMAKAWRQAVAQTSAENRADLLRRQLDWLQDRAIGCGLDPRQPAFHILGTSPAECLTDIYQRWRQDMLERPVG